MDFASPPLSPAPFSQLQLPLQSPLRFPPAMEILLEEEEEEMIQQQQGQPAHSSRKEEQQSLSVRRRAEEIRQRMRLVDIQANRLFKLCDKDSKGFIVRADLECLESLISKLQFLQLERVFELADRFRVNLVYEKEFLKVIKPILLGQYVNGQLMEFSTISLDHDGRKKSPSDGEWSPTQKLTISIDGGMHNGGLAAVNRSSDLLGQIGFLAQHSPSSPSEYWPNGHSPSALNAVSLHDDLMISATASGGKEQHPRLTISGLPTQVVSVSTEIQSPGSAHSDPLPFRENGEIPASFFQRRLTCAHEDLRTPDRIFKVVFVGDSAVGKTCFLHRFCHNRFKPLFSATIGVDFTVRTLKIRERFVALQLWDTAGQERFRSITKQYFRKADGVVLMYDVTSESSFINVRNWIESVRVGVDDGCVLCLVGNKVDLYPNEHCRTITYQHGQELAKEFDMLFFETSAFSGQGIEECMQAMGLRLQQREDEHLEELIKLDALMANGKRRCCI